MKKTVRIFNPEHDLALAFGAENYTAPPMAQRLRRDLQLLPAWISSPHDSLLSQNTEDDTLFLNSLNSKYSIEVFAFPYSSLNHAENIIPWGWDYDLRKRLFTSGAQSRILPSDSQIDSIRQLSHRRLTIEFQNILHDKISEIQCPIPVELNNFNDIHSFAVNYSEAYIKAPWSASGKGIFRVLDSEAIEFERWCRGILRRQGSILCEQPLSPLMDFALEFECLDGCTSFIGYSIFHNDAHRSFDSGEVMSSAKLRDKICSTLQNDSLIDRVKAVLIDILNSKIAPFYNGCLGIDMLIYQDADNSPLLNPCIEINLRHTMGIVTSIIGDKFINPASQGIFKIEYHKKPISSVYIKNIAVEHPLKIQNGKIIEGFQLLAPLYNDSRYCAYIIVNRD